MVTVTNMINAKCCEECKHRTDCIFNEIMVLEIGDLMEIFENIDQDQNTSVKIVVDVACDEYLGECNGRTKKRIGLYRSDSLYCDIKS